MIAPRNWSGNMEEFSRKAAETLEGIGNPDVSEPTVRLIRDYMQRGILGDMSRKGREVIFEYGHLVRFVAARLLLADGWPLSKIKEHFDLSSPEEIEALIPGAPNRAVLALERIRSESAGQSGEPRQTTHFRDRAARVSSIHGELRDALQRLGIPDGRPATEELTLFAVAPWCQLLVQSDRLSRITLEAAEDIGHAVTASLISHITRKGTSR